MAHGHQNEKVVYVGDSRVRKRDPMLPRDYSAYPGKSDAFIPNFLLKEWMVGVVVLVGILVLVIQEPAPLGYPADPLNTVFIPMPDWYFLFLYQLLKYKYAAGDFVLLGTVVIPGLAFGALMLAPWLDTGKERRLYRRPIAASLMMLAVIATIYLTWESVAQHDWEAAAEQGKIVEEADINTDAEGYEIYTAQGSCIGCHGDTMAGGASLAPRRWSFCAEATEIRRRS